MLKSKHLLVFKLSVFMLLFAVAFFCTPSVSASSNLLSVAVTRQYESTTKYFYSQTPVVSGVISNQVRGVIVYFDNISSADDYSVSVNQTYPATSFSTQNDCFSSALSGSVCTNVLPAGTYKISVDSYLDIYDSPETLVFSKLLVVMNNGQVIDQVAPAKPVLDSLPVSIDADNLSINGTAESNSLVTIVGNGQTKTEQLSGGNTRFSLTISLTQNAQNSFWVMATDDAGNVSDAANVNVLEATATTPVTPVVSVQRVVPKNVATSTPVPVAVSPQAVSLPAANQKSENNIVGTVEGASTTKQSEKPGKLVMFLLYLSLAFFLIIWGLYFQKKFFMHRATIHIDKTSKKNKIK